MAFAERWMNHLRDNRSYVKQVTCKGFRPPSMPHTQIETVGDSVQQIYFGAYDEKKIPDTIGIAPAGVSVVEMESSGGVTFRIGKGRRKPTFSVRPTFDGGSEVPRDEIAKFEDEAKELGYKVIKYKV
jgi:hypothetical protein